MSSSSSNSSSTIFPDHVDDHPAKLKFLAKKFRRGSPTRKLKTHNVEPLAVKVHTVETAAVVIPEPRQRSSTISSDNSKLQMENCAFELKDPQKETAFVHPVDQPINLSNGKQLYPNGKTKMNDNNKHPDQRRAQQHNEQLGDAIKMISVLFENLIKLAKFIWDLDLYVNVYISEGSKWRVHIPSIILGLVSLKVLLTAGSSSSHSTRNYSTTNGSGSFTSLIIIGSIICYLYYKFINLPFGNNVSDSSSSTTAAFNTNDAKSIPNLKKLVSFNNSDQDDQYMDYDIIHRKQNSKEPKLKINAPTPNLSKDSINRIVMKRLTDNGRDEMLKLFT